MGERVSEAVCEATAEEAMAVLVAEKEVLGQPEVETSALKEAVALPAALAVELEVSDGSEVGETLSLPLGEKVVETVAEQ